MNYVDSLGAKDMNETEHKIKSLLILSRVIDLDILA